MSLLIANAESALATCLECMEEILTSCIEDVMPQTSLTLPDEVQDTEVSSLCQRVTNSEHYQEEEQHNLLQEQKESIVDVINDKNNTTHTKSNKNGHNFSEAGEMTSMLTSSVHKNQRNEYEQELAKCKLEEYNENDIPDTLKQRLEWEMTQEQHRVVALWQQLRWRISELQSALVQLGGGVNDSGQLVDIPVESLNRDIAKLSSENAKLGQQMIELYKEADCIADRLTREIMSVNVENLENKITTLNTEFMRIG